MGLFLGFLLNTVCSITIGLLIVRGGSDILALVIEDVATQVETFSLCHGRRRGGAVCGREGLAGGNSWVWTWLERLQTTRGIGDDTEMARKWWSDIGRARLRVNLSILAGVH